MRCWHRGGLGTVGELEWQKLSGCPGGLIYLIRGMCFIFFKCDFDGNLSSNYIFRYDHQYLLIDLYIVWLILYCIHRSLIYKKLDFWNIFELHGSGPSLTLWFIKPVWDCAKHTAAWQVLWLYLFNNSDYLWEGEEKFAPASIWSVMLVFHLGRSTSSIWPYVSDEDEDSLCLSAEWKILETWFTHQEHSLSHQID